MDKDYKINIAALNVTIMIISSCVFIVEMPQGMDMWKFFIVVISILCSSFIATRTILSLLTEKEHQEEKSENQ
ncbi:TPA: hypothetical protein OMS91_003315 [Enterobacter kobei]|nr:hypothetical protein [Enterobacter kobei]HCR0506309.1 hypothetical protein [Enterobacter kobei]HCR0865398.1 hypothetical protein [Enterobacter kobei]